MRLADEVGNSRRLRAGHLAICRPFLRVSDRIRTGDRLDHNQELYQLSYAHRALFNVTGNQGAEPVSSRGARQFLAAHR